MIYLYEKKKSLKIMTFDIIAIFIWEHTDGLIQERRNSIANALELRLSCTNPSKSFLH